MTKIHLYTQIFLQGWLLTYWYDSKFKFILLRILYFKFQVVLDDCHDRMNTQNFFAGLTDYQNDIKYDQVSS